MKSDVGTEVEDPEWKTMLVEELGLVMEELRLARASELELKTQLWDVNRRRRALLDAAAASDASTSTPERSSQDSRLIHSPALGAAVPSNVIKLVHTVVTRYNRR